jgi:hypothetical protein
METLAVTNKEGHENIYRNLHEYSQDIKLTLKDIQSMISTHCLTVKPDFDNLNTRLAEVEVNTDSIISKIVNQSSVVEALIKINGNIEKMDQLIMILFNHINNSNISANRPPSSIGNSNGISEIKF